MISATKYERGSDLSGTTECRPLVGFISSRYLTVLTLMLGDVMALGFSVVLAVWIRWKLGGMFPPERYWQLWPALLLFILMYEGSGLYHGTALYPGVALGPAEELRRLTYGTTGVYLAIMQVAFFLKRSHYFSRLVFLGSLCMSIVAVPAMRLIIRKVFSRWGKWGIPAVVLGAGDTGVRVVKALTSHPEFGVRPVLVFDDDKSKWGQDLCGVPIAGPTAIAEETAAENRIRHAIIALPSTDWTSLCDMADRASTAFPHVLIIPDYRTFSSLWVTAQDVGGLLGLEIRQRLLLRGPRMVKALLDVALVLVLGLVALPGILLIALLIKLTSPGPVFYAATRLGRDGKEFRAYKFRTMIQDADNALNGHLEEHPESRSEWEETQKLRLDPRVTRIGYWLRRTSLDELPQLWNVMRREMSIVGPRPIVREELRFYGDAYERFNCRVKPGITGLWQVSGRNNTAYEERVRLDSYYVRNWSVWLDIYILLKTVKAVATCHGAY